LTIAWNVVEATVAITAGVAAGSIALVGFGFDSTIEVLSAWVVVWQFRAELRGGYDETRERLALRLVGATFFVLAGYLVIEAGRDLFTDSEANESPVGMTLAAVSLAVMPVLAWAKRRTADRLGSPTLRADATETLLCSWLSITLLAGLVLNTTLGWWWADPLAAAGIAALAAHEGLGAWGDEPTTTTNTTPSRNDVGFDAIDEQSPRLARGVALPAPHRWRAEGASPVKWS
jgi:divalent metal cation (Fe/Co/Zn/Cd) transporter